MDVCVIGCGPAGISGAICLEMAGYDVMIFEEKIIGGQMNTTPEIRNLAGVGDISGWELSAKMCEQLKNHNIRVLAEKVIDVDIKNDTKKVITQNGVYPTKAILVANGVIRRELGCDGEEKFKGRGVSYCAVCDGFFFKGKIVSVVGGGNTAFEDALYLSKICKKVYIIHRREEFRGNKEMLERIKGTPNIEIITCATVDRIVGSSVVEEIILNVGDVQQTLKTDGVFVAIGLTGDNELFSKYLSLDDNGYIITDEMCKTDCEGVYAAGDTRNKKIRQIVTAMSDGAVASEGIIKYLSQKDNCT